MKILLLGEYSNVHNTLAIGLRQLGHQVTVVSNGDFWKNYPRDIDVARRSGKLGGILLMLKLCALLPRLRGYDVVQLINPMFFELRAERLFWFYRYLRSHNKRVFLGAFGMDYYWVHECTYRKPLRYSDFNFGNELRTDENALKEQRDWLGTAKERLNRLIADECDGIITGLYEYQACYQPNFPDKTQFIPFPIEVPEKSAGTSDKNLKAPDENKGAPDGNKEAPDENKEAPDGKPEALTVQKEAHLIRIFVGISRERSAYKGTDVMLRAAEAVAAKYNGQVELRVANGVPFAQYRQMLDGSDVLLDQLYAYTPAMNALLAMSKGIVVVGGGEPENYEILGEEELRPIINVEPNYNSVYHELEQLALHPERIPELKRQSIEYIRRHHDYIKVAQQYEQFYKRKSRSV